MSKIFSLLSDLIQSLKQLLHRHRYQGTFLHRILGERLFEKELWHISRHSLSGGFALGLFIAFTPTIPFHMLLCFVLALWMRVNLPMALTACWINNPLTAFPIYMFTFKIGRAVVGKLPASYLLSNTPERFGRYFVNMVNIVTGGVLIGAAAALAGYILVQILWQMFSKKQKNNIMDKI